MIVFKIVVSIIVLIYVLEFHNLRERVSTLEKEIYLYINPKVKEIVKQATLKEGDN